MASDKGGTFPVAALGVVALLLSAIFVAERPFDLPRLGESNAARRDRMLQPPIEARLWEDPFVAVKRYREKVKPQCPASKPKIEADPVCRGGWPEIRDKTTIIAVLLPGEDFVGNEEIRRRTRYAVLAGLAQEGFLPVNSERIGFVQQQACNWLGDCTGALFDAPYETFKTDERSPKHVLVVWVDDAALGPTWLSRVVSMLEAIRAVPSPDLRIIGPSDSRKLVEGLNIDFADIERQIEQMDSPHKLDRFVERWRTLTRTTVISPFATTAEDKLLDAVDPSIRERYPIAESLLRCNIGEKCVAGFLNDRLKAIGRQVNVNFDEEGYKTRRFVSTIGTDQLNVELLVKELCARGVAESKGNKVVLLREWDSVYARKLADSLKAALKSAPCKATTGSDVDVDAKIYSYLRGLDGVTTEGAPKERRLVPRRAGDKEKTDAPDIEWPETRDQRDYVRRLVDRMKSESGNSDTNNSIAAIGLLGTDVHDKLILAQALRPTFPDRLLFTTDLDARLFHPEVLPFTRNLVVASSLPLEPPFLDGEHEGAVRVPPFRDVYQTSTFYAARYAVASLRLHDIDTQLKHGHLFEIGRHGAVELGIGKPADSETHGRRVYGSLSLVILAGAAWLILVGKPAPSMKDTRSLGPLTSVRRFRRETAVLSGMTVAALGFGFGVVAELWLPGDVRLSGALTLAALSAILFFGFRYPGIGASPARFPRLHPRMVLAWRRRRIVRIVVPVAVLALAMGLRGWSPDAAMPEPFAVSEGVSAWPSELLRTLAIVLFPWLLDFVWNKGIDIGRGIGRDFFAFTPVKPRRFRPAVSLTRCLWHVRRLADLLKRHRAARSKRRKRYRAASPTLRTRYRIARGEKRALFLRSRYRRFQRAFAAVSLLFWRPQLAWKLDKRVDGRRLWHAYRLLSRNRQRVCRLLCWLVVTVAVIGAIAIIVGGPWQDLPVRGLDDRALFRSTAVGCTVAILVLLVMATNAALLTLRLISIMNRGRTVYPREIVHRFASELGPRVSLAPHLYYPVAARVYDRDKPGFDARNSLFDPWIDARFLARHTEAVSKLIYFPFVLLVLFVLSRSRLFDNWPLGGPISIALTCYLLWAVAAAALLSYGAELARSRAIEMLEKDLLWLNGAGQGYRELAEQFPKLIEQVRDLRQGAFAPLTQQPLVHAIIVPLGVGGVQLLEVLLVGR